MRGKERLSATVDAELLGAAQDAVAKGRAENVSAWVNEALRRHVEHERRLAAFEAFIGEYEAEHGVITEQEMVAAERWAREQATVVGGKRRAAR